jgi:23S rRNA (guanosine2251-2'-O)-methyltransferase
METTEELIYGKNAVLSYLERAIDNEQSLDFKVLQDALAQDVYAQELVETQISSQSKELVSEVKKALHKMKNDFSEKSLNSSLSQGKQLINLPTVKINKIMLALGMEKDARIDKIKNLAKKQKIPIQSCDRRKLDQIAGPNSRHQGVIAVISASELWQLETFLQKLALDTINRQLKGQSMNGYTVAIVDGIEDPHNLGAIIRSAEAAGVKALFVPQRRAVGLTSTVAKVSAGALATLPVVRVSNIVHALETLKKYGFWVIALDKEAKEFHTEVDLKRPVAVVIGSEGKGIGRLVREHCDIFVKIPMLGKTESLNASVAAGIFFYEVVRQCFEEM